MTILARQLPAMIDGAMEYEVARHRSASGTVPIQAHTA